MPLRIMPSDRYDYVIEAGRATVTGPHTHDVPVGCEPPGDPCTGCIIVADNADIEVRHRADGSLKQRWYVDDRGRPQPGTRPRTGER